MESLACATSETLKSLTPRNLRQKLLAVPLEKEDLFKKSAVSRSTESIGSSLTFCRLGLQKGSALAITADDIEYHARTALVSEKDGEPRIGLQGPKRMTEFPDIIHRPETGASSIDWVHLRRLYLRMETESSLRNVAF
jgi:hypothetical protein